MTQTTFRSESEESGTDSVFPNLLTENLPIKSSTNALYGMQFSNVSDPEELISSCQAAEKQYAKERFSPPVPESDVALKSRKR